MEKHFTIKEIREFLMDPFLCGICMKKTGNVHVCMTCKDILPRMLPIVSIGDGKRYFFDKRLRQLRNIDNPHDYIEFKNLTGDIKWN